MPHLLNPYRFATSGTPATNLEAALGSLNTPNTTTTGTTVSVTGLSFQPKLVFLWMPGVATGAEPLLEATHAIFASWGMFSATEQYSWGAFHDDNNTNILAGGIHRTDACLIQSGGSGTAWRAIEFHSMNADGFTIKVHATNAAQTWFAFRVGYLALGGTDLSDMKIGTVAPTTGTGNEAFTPLSFQPTALVFPSWNASLNTYLSNVQAGLGMATGASNMFVWSGFSASGVGTSNTQRYLRSDECAAMMGATAGGITTRTRLVSLDATGFTLNKLESFGSSYTLPYCAIRGPNVKVGTFTAGSGGGSVTGVGFTPKAIVFVTHGTTENTADTRSAEFIWSIGASLTGITQRSGSAHDIHNLAVSDTPCSSRADSVAHTISTAAALDSTVSISSHDSDGFTYTMPTSTNNGYLVGYLALG
jgi:hypothetical protein